MRSITIVVSLLLLTIFIYLSGCSDSVTNSTGTTSVTNQARTEREFHLNPGLKAEQKAVLLIHLEHLDTPADSLLHDTGTSGIDIIPIKFSETISHEIHMQDSAQLTARLVSDSSGAIIYELTPGAAVVSVIIPAGNYKLYLTSLLPYSPGNTYQQNIFIQPDADNLRDDAVTTYIHRNMCEFCDFTNANLSGLNMQTTFLHGCNFTQANLTGSQFTGIIDTNNFTQANLTSVNFSTSLTVKNTFTNAVLVNATIVGTNAASNRFINANLTGANLIHSEFQSCNFSNANLTNANISYSKIGFTNFCGANKTGLISDSVQIPFPAQCWP